MIRALVLGLMVLSSLLSSIAQAQTSSTGWIKVASTTLDMAASGSKTLDLPDITFLALRIAADKTVTIGSVKTSSGGTFSAGSAPVFVNATQPSAPFYSTKDAGGLKQIELIWSGQPTAGTVRIEIWAFTGREAAKPGTGAPRDSTISGSSDDTTSSSKPAPHTRSSSPATRSIGSARPPPPPVAESPAPSKSSPSKKADEPSGGSGPPTRPALPPVVNSADTKTTACDGSGGVKACTIVDIYFGTDRKTKTNPDRVDFSGERAFKLQLGHAFVTVPNANRKRGEVNRPGWVDWIKRVPPEGDPARHFTIPKGGVTLYMTDDEFVAAARAHAATAGAFKDHAFIFVHGFAVTFDNALYRTAQIAYDLSEDGTPFGTAFLYSWPSVGSANPIGYVTDQESAHGSATHLQKFIRTVIDKTGIKNIHIIAHSMGNVALIDALNDLARTEKTARINQIILAAPDIDKQQFENIITGVGQVAKGFTLYASQGDKALYASRRAHSGLPRAGETTLPPGPAVVKGVDTIDVTKISTDAFWGHDTYADSAEILADIATVFIKGDPPPKRSPKIRFGAMKYWIYDK